MDKIRVLVVDDSAFMRKVVSDILSDNDYIEVVDTARDGVYALEKLNNLNVDVITLDVEMPRMNGLDVLKIINEKYNIPVIMLSSLTSDGADITIKALELGAFDFVLKPTMGSKFDIEGLKFELQEKIKICYRQNKKVKKDEKIGNIVKTMAKQNSDDIKAICIAASTGGPKALSTVMQMFPDKFKLPVFIVQHMPAGFTNAFAKRLNQNSKLEIKEAENDDKIYPGHGYLAPGGYHMTIKNDRICLDQEMPMLGVRPCADRLFISAAQNIKGRVIGIVLTGMGKDGTNGLCEIKKNGGIGIAEDESTCTIFGMPKSAIEKGVVDIVVPLDRVVPELLKILD